MTGYSNLEQLQKCLLPENQLLSRVYQEKCANCFVIMEAHRMFLCRHCKNNRYCDTCIIYHTKARHQVLDFTGQDPATCSRHRCLSQFFCVQCSQSLCLQCTRDHVSHQVNSVHPVSVTAGASQGNDRLTSVLVNKKLQLSDFAKQQIDVMEGFRKTTNQKSIMSILKDCVEDLIANYERQAALWVAEIEEKQVHVDKYIQIDQLVRSIEDDPKLAHDVSEEELLVTIKAELAEFCRRSYVLKTSAEYPQNLSHSEKREAIVRTLENCFPLPNPPTLLSFEVPQEHSTKTSSSNVSSPRSARSIKDTARTCYEGCDEETKQPSSTRVSIPDSSRRDLRSSLEIAQDQQTQDIVISIRLRDLRTVIVQSKDPIGDLQTQLRQITHPGLTWGDMKHVKRGATDQLIVNCSLQDGAVNKSWVITKIRQHKLVKFAQVVTTQ